MKPQFQQLTYRWQLLTQRIPQAVQIVLVGLFFTAVHTILFFTLQPKVGYFVTSFIMLPVLIFAWQYGLRAGVIALFFAFFINTVLIAMNEKPFPVQIFLGGLTGHLFTLVAAIIVGKFKDLSVRLNHELTERRQIEQTLQEKESRYRLLSENLSDLICLHQLDSTLTYLSSSIEEMLGYSYQELLGKKPFHLFHPDDIVHFRSPEYLQTIQQGTDFTVEGRMRHKDGHYLWVESRIRPFTHSDNDKNYWQSITRDVSQRKEQEIALQKAKEEAEDANRTKSEFLANMSHEIRTPMNAIIGLTGLMLDSPLDPEQQDFIETIRASGDGLLTIINDILDFSKIEAGKLDLENAPYILRQCVEDVLDLTAAKAGSKGLELVYLIDDQIPRLLMGDVTRLRQILVNLVGNAVKFTSEGEVFVSITQLNTENKKQELRFSVLDTGIGIPKERMERLFKSFSQVDSSTTRQFGGTGLGLVISKRLVEAMGGRMWVESEPGKGSTFSFTILADEVIDDDVDDVETAVPLRNLSGKRILVVDDNDVNRLIMKHYLYRWQADSYIVDSGEEALNLLAHGEQFDLAILDMQMPHMDGVMLARAIQDLLGQRPFPLLLLSSLDQLPDRESKALFAAHVAKPVKPNILFRIVEEALTKKKRPMVKKVVETAVTIPQPPKRPLRILLAEDNTINQKVALRMLERLGYHAGVAGNGHEVLEALQQYAYDIILMDVQMPEMDGVEATQLIRQDKALSSQPHIIALTANALKGDRERFLGIGMDDYLSKPVRMEDLATALEKYTHQPIPN